MKTLLKTSVAVSFSTLLISSVLADEYAIVIASDMEKVTRQSIYQQLIGSLSQTKSGDSYIVLDGSKAKKIAYFSHSKSDKSTNPNKRFKSWLPSLKKLSSFCSADKGNLNQGSINMPDVIDYLRSSKKNYHGVAIFGSSRYVSSESFYSMKDNLCPSHGCILLPRSESPYGLKGYQGIFKNTILAWYIPESIEWSSHWHKESVANFWAVSWGYLGGKTDGKYISDIEMTLDVIKGEPDNFQVMEIDSSQPASMIQLEEQKPILLNQNIDLNNEQIKLKKDEPALADVLVTAEVTPEKTKSPGVLLVTNITEGESIAKAIPIGVELRLKWESSKFDLDLELKSPDGKTLSFRNEDYQDFEESHNHVNGTMEIKTFRAEALELNDLIGWKAYVNVHSGHDKLVRAVAGSLEEPDIKIVFLVVFEKYDI